MTVRLDRRLNCLDRFSTVKLRTGVGWAIDRECRLPLDIRDHSHSPGSCRMRALTGRLVAFLFLFHFHQINIVHDVLLTYPCYKYSDRLPESNDSGNHRPKVYQYFAKKQEVSRVIFGNTYTDRGSIFFNQGANRISSGYPRHAG